MRVESNQGHSKPAPASGRNTSVLALVLVTMIIGLPLLFGRVLAGQDIVNYLIHAQQTAENLRQGVFFPSWGGGYNSGFGSPVLLFFPPVTSYLGAIVMLAGVPVILGVGWLALMAHLCSGVAVLGWLRSAGFERSALPAAIVYMIGPYRLVDLYLRSALAEHWAFLWPPLILWIAGSPRLRPLWRVTLTALSVAGLLLTNVPLAILFGIGLAIWFVVSKRIHGQRLQVASGVGLGFGLAVFSLVPLALASTLLDLDGCFGAESGRFRPSSNTLFVGGPFDHSLNVLFSWTVVATFSLAVATWVLLGRTRRESKSARWAMIAAIACLAGTTGPAGPVWDATPILANIQFPWRISAVLTLVTVGLVARLETRRAWVVVALAGALAVPFSSWDRTMKKTTFLSEKPAHRDRLGTVFPDPFTAWEAGSGGWYWRHHHLVELCLLPKDMPKLLLGEFAGSPHSSFDNIRGRPAVLLEDPTIPVEVIEWDQIHRSIKINSPREGTLMWRVLWFSNMQVRVDGVEVPVAVDRATGLLTHAIPPGSHQVDWRWRPFAALRLAQGFSVLAFIVVVALGGTALVRRRSQVDGRVPEGIDDPMQQREIAEFGVSGTTDDHIP